MRIDLLTVAVVSLLWVPAGIAGPGREFWSVLSEPLGLENEYNIAVGNPNLTLAATVVIETEGGVVDSATVPPLGSFVFSPGFARVATGSVKLPLAYRVTSDLPVHAYQMLEFDSHGSSPAGAVLIDRTHFGREFIALTRPADNIDARPGIVTIVAPARVRVEVTPAQDTQAGLGVAALTAGVTSAFDLEAFEVLQLASFALGDLTGTVITADAPIEVFAGCSYCEWPVSAADDVQEWMLPVASWGKTYQAVSSYPMTLDTNKWRILASADGTDVTTDPVQSGTPVRLDRGEYVEIDATSDFEVIATAPVLVARYTMGCFDAENGSDPSMSLMLPPALFAKGAVFPLSDTWWWYNRWLDIVAPPAAAVTVDGALIPAGDYTAVGTSGYRRTQVRLSDSLFTHRVESDVPVGIYVGFSYAQQTMTFPAAIGFHDNLAPVCSHGGPYTASCTGPTTSIPVSGAASSDPESQPLTFRWSSTSPSIAFDDAALTSPEVTVSGLGTFPLTLTVSDGVTTTNCATTVTTTGAAATPPELDRFTTPLWLVKRGPEILFSFAETPTALAFNVYEGAIGSYWSHSPLACEQPGTPASPSRRELRLTPAPGSQYYLMTGSSCSAEGASGADPALNACPP